MSAQLGQVAKSGKTAEARYRLGGSTASSIDDFAIKKRRKQILEHISLERKIMLDVGCGNGLYILTFANSAKETIGIDISREGLAEAIKNKAELGGDTEFIRASAEGLPLCDSTFDVVLLVEMLEHVRSQQKTLEEVNRVLKDGGYLLIYVPNKLYLFDMHGLRIGQRSISGLYGSSVPFFSWCPQLIRNKFERAKIYTKGQIITLLKKHGFIIQAVDYMYPPLDRLGNEFTKCVLRRITSVLEHNRFLKRFGMSIFIVAQKRES